MTGPYLRHLKRSLNACAGSTSKGVGNYKPSYYSCGEAGGNSYSWNDKYGSSSDDSSSSYSYSGGGDGDLTILWIILGVVYGLPLLCCICSSVGDLSKDCLRKYKFRRQMRKFNENFRKHKESLGVIYLDRGDFPTENDIVSGPDSNAKNQLGNNLYWKIILESREAFSDVKDTEEKLKFAQSIQEAIAAENGRFLHKDANSGRWYIIPPTEVNFKIRKALHPKASVPSYYLNYEATNKHDKNESDEITQSSLSTTSPSDLSYLPHSEVPTENDVVSGPNSNARNQPANKLYWKLILESRPAFNNTNPREAKQMIVEAIQNTIAVKSGRFLHRESKTGRWFVLPPNKVQFKIRQALHPRAAVPKYVINGEEKSPENGIGAANYLFQVNTTHGAQQLISPVDLEAQHDIPPARLPSATEKEHIVGGTENKERSASHITLGNGNNGTPPSLFETVYSSIINYMNANSADEMLDVEDAVESDVQVYSG